MWIKLKSYFLKPELDPKTLINYGFEECPTGYLRNKIKYYTSTRRFVIWDPFWKKSRAYQVRRHIHDLIKANLVDKIPNYEYLSWSVPKNKQTEIEQTANIKNKKERIKYYDLHKK